MVRLIGALILVLVIVTPSFGQQSLVGTYKLVSFVAEVDGTPTQPLGKAPRGYAMYTPTRYIVFITGDNRKFGTSVADKAALFDSLLGYAGTYRVAGDKLILTDEISWRENNIGKTEVVTFQLSGNRLTIRMGPIPLFFDPSKKLIKREVWEKTE